MTNKLLNTKTTLSYMIYRIQKHINLPNKIPEPAILFPQKLQLRAQNWKAILRHDEEEKKKKKNSNDT